MLGALRPRTGLGQRCLGQGALRPTRTNVRMTAVRESINRMFDSLALKCCWLSRLRTRHGACMLHAPLPVRLCRVLAVHLVPETAHGLHHARNIVVVTSGCERSSRSADAAMSGAATATANGNGSAKQQAARTHPAANCARTDSLDQLTESADRSPRQGSWCASCVACCSTSLVRYSTALSLSCGYCGWSGFCDMHCCTGSTTSGQGPVWRAPRSRPLTL